MLKLRLYIFAFLIFALNSYGQKTDFSPPDTNWKYIFPKDTTTVKVVEYFKANVKCGVFFITSMAICIDSNNDSLRIIEHCPDIKKDYKPGQKLKFYPYKHVTEKNLEKYQGGSDDESNRKYKTVSRTAFGDLRLK